MGYPDSAGLTHCVDLFSMLPTEWRSGSSATARNSD
jgi:hypothetical protein